MLVFENSILTKDDIIYTLKFYKVGKFSIDEKFRRNNSVLFIIFEDIKIFQFKRKLNIKYCKKFLMKFKPINLEFRFVYR